MAPATARTDDADLESRTDEEAPLINPPLRAARNGQPAVDHSACHVRHGSLPPPRQHCVHAYDAPWVSVTSLHQMDGEFSFLQRLAEYGMVSHLAYKTGAVTRGETEMPPSVGGFAVQHGDRLTDFYGVMIAAVQHGVPFAYHFSLERKGH